MIGKTLLHGQAKSAEKQLTLDNWVDNTLKIWAENGNRTLSKGIVAYESLLFTRDDVRDEFTFAEEAVDELLDNTVDTNFSEKISRINNQFENENPGTILKNHCDGNSYKRLPNRKIWVPTWLEEELPFGRGWSEALGNALTDAYRSAYQDRGDRVRVKREIFDYVQNDIEPEHPVSRAVIFGENEQDYVIPEEVRQEFTEEEWWESDAVTYRQIQKYQADDDLKISQKDWTKRFFVFHQARLNDDRPYLEKLVKKMMGVCFDIKNPQLEKQFESYKKQYNVSFEHPITSEPVDRFELNKLPALVEELDVKRLEHQAILVDKAFENCEKKDKTKLGIPTDIAGPFFEAGLISDEEPSTVVEHLLYLDGEFGIPSMKEVKSSKVYLSTFIDS